MKRLYIKPYIKVVACRPMSFITNSANPAWNVDAEGGGGPTGDIGSDEPIPKTSRESKYIWDE